MNLNNIILEELNNLTQKYIYHGTGKGQLIRIMRDGYLKPNNVGEKMPSISFSGKIDYAKYYANMKGGSNPVLLRTKLDNRFKISDRIKDNKDFEYITFDKIPVSDIEILSNGKWVKLFN